MLALTKPEKKILFGVFSILLAMCTMAYLTHRNSQRLILSSEAIENSEEIKYHIQEIQSISVNMESGVRGYVLTGDESYMAPTNEAVADLFLHLHQLIALPGITEDQTKQIAHLRQLVDEKSSLATMTAELRRQKGMEEALIFFSSGKEKNLMAEIRNITNQMITEEDENLTTLKAENRNAILHFAVTFYLLLLKIAITVVTVIFLFIFYLRKRNKAERTLKESQALFHDVLDHSDSIISIKDLSGRYMLVNRAYEKVLNTPKESFRGNTAYDLFEKKYAEPIRHSDLEVIRMQQQIKTEESVPDSFGEMHHFTSLKFPLFDQNHIPYAICSISTDETEKMHLEKLHQEEMKRILDLFNNAPCGYQSTDKNGILIEINETLLKWLGYKRNEVIGKMPVKNIISPESLQQFAYYFPRLRSGEINSFYDVEAVYIRKDGTKFSIVANSIAVYDEDGQFMHTRTSVFDISYRKRVEEVVNKN